MKSIYQIANMLESCSSESPNFPPTDLYNEGWLLRLVLHWFYSNNIHNHPLTFSDSSSWFSEALLPSAFLPRFQKDPLGESWTHADGVIGHFNIGNKGKGDLSLSQDAQQLIVLEAKIYSKLLPGVTHASYFDQAARNVACIAEVLNIAKINPNQMSHIAFHVLAPKSQIDADVFAKNMNKESIIIKLQRRVDEYNGEKDGWYRDWFIPLMDKIKISCINWEKIIKDIGSVDNESGHEINEFYELCKIYNGKGLSKT